MPVVRDKKELDKAQGEQKSERDQELVDLKAVLSTKQGRRFIWRLLSEAKMFQPCFTGNSNTFYLLGAKEFMLKLFTDCQLADKEAYITMFKENTGSDDTTHPQ